MCWSVRERAVPGDRSGRGESWIAHVRVGQSQEAGAAADLRASSELVGGNN